MMMNIVEFYNKAKKFIIDAGYEYEIKVVDSRRFKLQTPDDFFRQYVYVVLNSGMQNQIAEDIYMRFWRRFTGIDTITAGHLRHIDIDWCNIDAACNEIGHPGKRKAVRECFYRYRQWFAKLCNLGSLYEKLDFLESLPWIGPITKYHLARNLGLDVAKPDRHLQRIAEEFSFDDVQRLCEHISALTNDRVGVVDLVLWRFCNLNPSKWKDDL